MKVKGPVACLLATLISVLATVTVAADTDSDSSATAAHGLSEARAAALAVKKEKRQVDRAEFYKDLDTVWDECPRFLPTSEISCDTSTLTSECTFGNPYSKLCEDPDGKCKRRKQCKCVAGKFTCTIQEGLTKENSPIQEEFTGRFTKEKCEALLNCDLEGNRGIPVEILEGGPSLRDLTAGGGIPRDNNIKYGKVVGCWDVSQVTNMDYGFWQRRGFNQPLCWDVSKVTSMKTMFYGARLDQDISFWDVSSVTNFDSMFKMNTLDPGDIKAYFTVLNACGDCGNHVPVDPSVRVATRTECEILNDCSAPGNRGVPVDKNGADFADLSYGFAFGPGWPPTHEYSKKYGIKFGCWDVSQVTDMSNSLGRAGLDTPLCWDVSSVTNMKYMFLGGQFNQDISFWDVSSVTDFSMMFYNQKRFNQDISAWNVSSAVTMKQMFSSRYALNTHNQNLCDWAPKISGDTDTADMFTNSYCPSTSGGLQ